jgi:branched-chain amino acid transport system permease protein
MMLRFLLVPALVLAGVGALCLQLNDYMVYVALVAVIWAIFAVGYDVLLGYTGYLSLAHGALYGIGAYAFALLTTAWGWTFWIALPAAAAVTTVAGALIAIAAFRTRGIYFAVLTLGIGLVGYQLFLVLESVTGGIAGFVGIPAPPDLSASFSSGQNNLVVSLVVLWVTWVSARWFVRSRVGAACIAVREDQMLARSLGIRVGFARLAAFAFSAFFCGAAGALFAATSSYIGPDSFTVMNTGFHVVVLVVVGGMGTLWGPILGAVLLTVLPESLRMASTLSLLIYAGLLLGCILLAPQGIAGALKAAWGALPRAGRLTGAGHLKERNP